MQLHASSITFCLDCPFSVDVVLFFLTHDLKFIFVLIFHTCEKLYQGDVVIYLRTPLCNHERSDSINLEVKLP